MDIPLETTLETPRCVLRVPKQEDNECVWTASRFNGFTDGMLWDPPETRQEIEEFREQLIERWKEGVDFGFSICLKEPGTCIGRIAMRKTDTDGIWNVGFWMHPDFQGKGLMKESLLSIIEWTFNVLGAQGIETAHAVWNSASEGLIKSTGFRHVRHNPQGFQKKGSWVEEEEYVLKKEDWMRENRTL